MERQTYLDHKFGGSQRAKRIYDVIAQTGELNGINFQFDKIAITPNSINSHRLIDYATTFDLDNVLVERLFKAYFMEGLNIGEMDILIKLAESVGLNGPHARDYLKGEMGREKVVQSDRAARELGVHGVPAFVARDRYVISGAQEAKILGRFIDTAWNG